MPIDPRQVMPPRNEEESPELTYHPNAIEGELPKHGACFLNQARACSSDCMAYLTTPPEGKAYLGENWAYCHILVNLDRSGRHLAILASASADSLSFKKKTMADATRGPQPKAEVR